MRPVGQDLAVRLGVVDAAGRALAYPAEQATLIGKGFWDVVFGNEPAEPGGPIRLVAEFYIAFSAGVVPGIKLFLALCVYLSLVNLLPIPWVFDGGRLAFLVYRMVTRRRAVPTR